MILLVAVPLSIERFGAINLAEAAVQRAKSFLELIQQRSPGARTRGQLIKTKRKKTVLHERALPKVRIVMPILPPGSPTALIDIVAPPAPIFPASFDVTPTSLLGPQPPPLPPVTPFAPPPGVIVPPEVPSTPPVVPPPALPEPQTWSTMLLGFGLIGWMLRRRRKDGLHALS